MTRLPSAKAIARFTLLTTPVIGLVLFGILRTDRFATTVHAPVPSSALVADEMTTERARALLQQHRRALARLQKGMSQDEVFAVLSEQQMDPRRPRSASQRTFHAPAGVVRCFFDALGLYAWEDDPDNLLLIAAGATVTRTAKQRQQRLDQLLPVRDVLDGFDKEVNVLSSTDSLYPRYCRRSIRVSLPWYRSEEASYNALRRIARNTYVSGIVAVEVFAEHRNPDPKVLPTRLTSFTFAPGGDFDKVDRIYDLSEYKVTVEEHSINAVHQRSIHVTRSGLTGIESLSDTSAGQHP